MGANTEHHKMLGLNGTEGVVAVCGLLRNGRTGISQLTIVLGQQIEHFSGAMHDPQGARDFDRITSENVKKRLAIVLDGVVYSAPVIQERISGGDAQITGSFSEEEAKI